MWSEIFTHDYENGEKVAIVLLDTQGIFDTRSSQKEVAAIFAISMLLSSVQCFNVSQQIQEDDLQHLEMFTEYGRLALEQSNEKPFQKLLFIIRDWPNANEIPFGNATTYVDESLDENDYQVAEMHQLRKRIKSSFDQINAFLLPYPGPDVANGSYVGGDLKQIDQKFVTYLKELVPSIFAPENLIVKKITGQTIRVRNLMTYLETYVNLFNGGDLPEPKTVFMVCFEIRYFVDNEQKIKLRTTLSIYDQATAEASILLLYTDCLNFYVHSMQTSVEKKSYSTQSDLQITHISYKGESLKQVRIKINLSSSSSSR